MSTEENKALVRRLCQEVFNEGKPIAGFLGPGFEMHRRWPNVDPDIFTEWHAEILDQVAEGDRVTSRWTAQYTCQGEPTTPWSAALRATGEHVTFT
jgi:hypothetical protein